MDQIHRMASSSSSDGERAAKASNPRQHGSAMVAQDLPPPPTLKCPRCDSSNTKFCYYNNYSQTQPRHFCKSCRRYWTQGGTLRNVPVGGGCRKNKRVRPRSLISMGGLDHGPTSFSETTSNMLGRLSSIGSSFGNGSEDASSSQLLNIAFARFQESMRLREQSAHSPDGVSDVGLPGLVHRPCGLSSACANGPTALHRCTGGPIAVDNFENNLGFSTLHAEGGYNTNNYEMPNPVYVYAQNPKIHSMMGTSATATLASLEDELSTFSNLQSQVNSFNAGGGDVAHEDQKDFDLQAGSATQLRLQSSALPQHLEHDGSHLYYVRNPLNRDFENTHAEDQRLMREDKPLIGMSGDSALSSMMPAYNWQQHTSSMDRLVFHEPHQGIMWSTNAPRWQDMHPAAAAGSVL